MEPIVMEGQPELSQSADSHMKKDVLHYGIDNMKGGSVDDQDPDRPPQSKKSVHRHSPTQIREMERLFKECPHPDHEQRQKLSKDLGLEPRQVKFWFQGMRTQMKAQLERAERNLLLAENERLRAENERLRAENVSLHEAIKKSLKTLTLEDPLLQCRDDSIRQPRQKCV